MSCNWLKRSNVPCCKYLVVDHERKVIQLMKNCVAITINECEVDNVNNVFKTLFVCWFMEVEFLDCLSVYTKFSMQLNSKLASPVDLSQRSNETQ